MRIAVALVLAGAAFLPAIAPAPAYAVTIAENPCPEIPSALSSECPRTLSTVESVPATSAVTVSGPSISAPAAMIMTMDGQVLWSRRPMVQRKAASTIKMLTALVVRDRTKLTDVVVVSKKAEIWDGGVGLVAGQKLTVKQLLAIMLIPSANDAAEALAIHVAGSQGRFVSMMNAKAHALGLTHTKAYDPHGLGKKEHTTAHDLAVLAQNVMADPVLHSIVRMKSVSVPRPGGGSSRYPSTDPLLGSYKGMEGVKTGYTDPAGYCFVGAAKRGKVELLGVVMGTSSNAERFGQMAKLLSWGFAHFHSYQIAPTPGFSELVRVTGGVAPTVTVHADGPIALQLFDGAGAPHTELALNRMVAAPVAARQSLGSIDVYQGDRFVGGIPLRADCAVPKLVVARASAPASEVAEQVGPPGSASWWDEAMEFSLRYRALLP